jgi:hypothetical protein
MQDFNSLERKNTLHRLRGRPFRYYYLTTLVSFHIKFRRLLFANREGPAIVSDTSLYNTPYASPIIIFQAGN